ncbi:hypothetical protein BFR47_14535 [Oceanisphaera psychrotolerans]|uniref:Uncharacterized protein n=1 Tax=Oceanisphaera psychrotolerans TaxID=1414654 RepID=A0A1J4QGT7_9GAMM|nr:hypothetical protein BFR47_14535 [Oceanisphaera psychrotolerans]
MPVIIIGRDQQQGTQPQREHAGDQQISAHRERMCQPAAVIITPFHTKNQFQSTPNRDFIQQPTPGSFGSWFCRQFTVSIEFWSIDANKADYSAIL